MTKKSFKKSDPNYQKELAKYGNPIPSRDYILQIIRENNAPMSREEILTALSIKSDEQQEAMCRRLRAMENDGQLVFTKRKRYALPEKLDLFKGMVIGHREGYGFLQVEGKKEDLFIPHHQMQRVMHGDFVLAQPAGLDRRGRREFFNVFFDRTWELVRNVMITKSNLHFHPFCHIVTQNFGDDANWLSKGGRAFLQFNHDNLSHSGPIAIFIRD